MPAAWQPYLRLSRLQSQASLGMLLWPCYWSMALALPPATLPDPALMALFLGGATLMRSAGCVINDMWDRDLDKHVARTKLRPLASGELGMTQATGLLAAQLTGSLGVLLCMNDTTIAMCLLSMPLVVIYPLMKRFTDVPQAVLGFAYSWGALVGYAAVTDSCSWATVPLYAGAVAWTLVYDTIYAHQDTKDDAKVGIKSSALFFGKNTKPILGACAGAMITCLAGVGVLTDMALPYYAGLGLATGHLTWQIATADLGDPANLRARFESNNVLGAIVAASAFAGRWFAA